MIEICVFYLTSIVIDCYRFPYFFTVKGEYIILTTVVKIAGCVSRPKLLAIVKGLRMPEMFIIIFEQWICEERSRERGMAVSLVSLREIHQSCIVLIDCHWLIMPGLEALRLPSCNVRFSFFEGCQKHTPQGIGIYFSASLDIQGWRRNAPQTLQLGPLNKYSVPWWHYCQWRHTAGDHRHQHPVPQDVHLH